MIRARLVEISARGDTSYILVVVQSVFGRIDSVVAVLFRPHDEGVYWGHAAGNNGLRCRACR